MVPELHSALRAEPINRGRFTRRVQVVSRSGELADIPDAEVSFAELPDLPEGTERASVEVLIRVRDRA